MADESVGARRGHSREVLLAAAARLFAERGPGAVSAREVARDAEVNYALIHRHFATKDGLLEAVLERLSQQAALDLRSAAAEADQGLSFSVEQEQLWRILGFLCLENGDYVRRHLDVHPGFDSLREVVAAASDDAELAAVRAGVGAVMVLGWVILRPFIDSLVALESVPEETVMLELSRAIQRAILPDGSSPVPSELDLRTGTDAPVEPAPDRRR